MLFRLETAQALIVFYGLVREINSSRQRMKEDEVQLTPDASDFIKAKASFAAKRIPELRRFLEAAGGIALPPGDPTWVSSSSLLKLGDPAFDSTKLVPGT